jgi:hypothetical protein
MHGTVWPEPEEQTMRRPTDRQIEYSPKIGLPLGVYGKRKKAKMMRRLPYASAFPQALKALAPHGTMCTINTRARLGERKRSATSGFLHWKSINQQCGAPDSSIGGATCGPHSQTTRRTVRYLRASLPPSASTFPLPWLCIALPIARSHSTSRS